MSFKERILEMEKHFAKWESREPKENPDEIYVTFISEFNYFEPCHYVTEDDETVTFILTHYDNEMPDQIMTMKKSLIRSFGVLSDREKENVENYRKPLSVNELYQ